MIKKISGEELDNELEQNEIAVLIFSGPGCNKCEMAKRKIEKESIEGVAFLELNAFREKELAIKYDVLSLPVIVVFKDGEQTGRGEGEGVLKLIEFLKKEEK